MKDFLSWEKERNKNNRELFTSILVEAFRHLENDGGVPACIIIESPAGNLSLYFVTITPERRYRNFWARNYHDL